MENVLERNTSSRITSIISLIALLVLLPLFISGVLNTVNILTRAVGAPANIVVDTTALLEPVDTEFIHAFAQGGEESADMIAPVVKQVSALKPRLIRIDHLYDHYNVVGRSGDQLTFDFLKLDAMVNSILATGAKPVFALSYMPSVIAKDSSVINPPNNWEDWSLVVQRTIEHYSGKGGRNMSGIYYEVWNEPDLAQFGSWKMGGEKNYLTLYQYAAVGASRTQNVNPFYFGGPSTTGLYKNWITGLLTSGFRVDFVSWHTYLSDPRRFAKDQANVGSWLLRTNPRYALLPKLITEYGFTGAKSGGYGSMYGAAHAAAAIRQLISGGPTYLFTFQLKDGPNQEAGDGWGLITHEQNGLKQKPRYYVTSFVDQMEGTRLALSGEGSWVTGFATIKDNVIKVFLINFDASGSHTENVPVSFANVPNGQYIYRERFLLGRDVKFTVTPEDGVVKREVFMPAQSIAILELSKTN